MVVTPTHVRAHQRWIPSTGKSLYDGYRGTCNGPTSQSVALGALYRQSIGSGCERSRNTSTSTARAEVNGVCLIGSRHCDWNFVAGLQAGEIKTEVRQLDHRTTSYPDTIRTVRNKDLQLLVAHFELDSVVESSSKGSDVAITWVKDQRVTSGPHRPCGGLNDGKVAKHDRQRKVSIGSSCDRGV